MVLKGINAYKRRIIFLSIFVVVGMGYIAFRLYTVQVLDHQQYLTRASKQQTSSVLFIPRRGDILDRKGKVLATSKMVYSLYCDPTLIEDNHEELAERLASILYKPKHEILNSLKKKGRRCVLLSRKISPRDAEEIETIILGYSTYCNPSRIKSNYVPLADQLSKVMYQSYSDILERLKRSYSIRELLTKHTSPGDVPKIKRVRSKFGLTHKDIFFERKFDLSRYAIFFRKEGKRVYPHDQLLSPVLGFVVLDKHGDNRGMGGLEYYYDKHLCGGSPKIATTRGARHILLDYFPEDTMNRARGASLELTIDESIQYVTERELRHALAREKADSGCAVVMDVSTGEVLAMASLPSFDPNEYQYYPLSLRRNNAISSPIEPGSVMKIFTFATLLEHGLLNLQDTVDCGSGKTVYFNNRPIKDAPGHAMDEVPVSMAFYYSSNVGTARLAERLENDIFYDQICAFGFGRKTGIDLSGEDNGILRPLRKWSLLSRTSLAIGYEIGVTSLQVARAVSAIANKGCLMKPYIVKRVVSPGGEVILENRPHIEARVVRPSVAERMLELMGGVVKYGTGVKAQISGYSVGGKTGTSKKVSSEEREYIASFVGVLPLSSPRLCIYVWIDNPRRHKYGGDVAAPVFRAIGEGAVKSLKIPPDEENVPETTPVPVDILAGEDTTELPPEWQMPTKVVHKEGTMPDLNGMTMREAFRELAELEITPQFVGTGVVIDQSPPPGKAIGPGIRCLLMFGDKSAKKMAAR